MDVLDAARGSDKHFVFSVLITTLRHQSKLHLLPILHHSPEEEGVIQDEQFRLFLSDTGDERKEK